MKHNLVTIGVVLALLAGITAFNIYFHQPPETPEQEQASEEAAKDLEAGEKLAAALEAEAAEMEEGDVQLAKLEAETAEAEHADHPGHAEHAEAETKETAKPQEAGGVPMVEVDWPEKMPDVFKLKFETSKGDFIMEIHKDWAPIGARRMWDLARVDFFKDMRFFRVIKSPRPFMCQFGLAADPKMNAPWGAGDKVMEDEKPKQSNQRGYVSFAMSSARRSRTTQMFINYADNRNLDTYGVGFAPFAKVIEGMEVCEQFNGQYGEKASARQDLIKAQGNAYLDATFPGLDYIKSVTLVQAAGESEAAPAESANTEE